MYTYNDHWLAHHGIIGQKWGVRNGPPYPLGSDVSTGSRLKSGASGSSVKTNQSTVKTNRKIKAAVNSGIGLKTKTREYTMDEDIAAVNPKYNPKVHDWEQPEWHTNCCYCTTAYEMRRRGYDVKAKPRSDDEKYHELTDWMYHPNEAMFNFTDDKVTKGFGVNEDLDINPRKSPVPKSKVNEIIDQANEYINKLPDGARGFLTCDWYCGGGHSLSFERVGNKVYVIDPQSNDKWDMTKFAKEADYASYIGCIWVTRVDDVDVIPGKIKGACS